MTTRTVTWLHLSDFHARKRDGWDARQIIEALVCDLKVMQRDHGLRPDFIFFTGDLAYGAINGEKMFEQYQLVRGFLEAVRTAFEPEISIRNIYLVPGNHDVDRDEILPEQTQWLRHSDRKLDEIISAMRDRKKQWRAWMDRLGSYRQFLTNYGLLHLVPDDPHLIWADSQEIHGIRIGIAGLNSAWSCADNDDKAKLWLGADWQIAEVKNRMGPVDFEFILTHHPGNWFTVHEDPSVMRRLKQEFAIVLHGHEHQEWVESNDEGHLVLSAGACYECSWMKNGYSFGRIDLEQSQCGIYLRQWDDVGRGWVSRNVATKTKDGYWALPNLAWLTFSDNDSVNQKNDKNETQVFADESAEMHYTQRYCNFVIDQHDCLELFGCDIPRELQRHQLSVAYVSLNLAREDQEQSTNYRLQSKRSQENIIALNEFEVEVEDKEPQKNIDDSSAALEHVLDKISAETGRLLINGPAGAGKSTLMRWCAIHAAQQVINNMASFEGLSIAFNSIGWNLPKSAVSLQVPGNWRKKIPFLIRLRDCPSGRLPAANKLPDFLAKHLPSAPMNWMAGVLDSGQGLFLFDGVDEIHRDQRRQLAEEIGELIRTYPNCTYVVTTRPGAIERGWLARLNFIEARVEPMSRHDREKFIEKWYCSAALELKNRPQPGEDLSLTASRLKLELAEQPELGLLATNPLLCAMICALYRERQEKLPETPAELSEALCQMLLHRRERETLGLGNKHFLSSWRELQYAQKKALLAELAWFMVKKGNSSIEREDAKSLVATILDSIPGQTGEKASDIVQALVERSGMLRPAGDNRIDFIHNTLKEYVAAGYVVESGDWQILAKHADDSAWQPVILFALALAPETYSSGLVRDLLTSVKSIKSPGKKTSSLTKSEHKALVIIKARQFFLVRCRASAKRLAGDLSVTIDSFLVDFLPPSSMNEAEALAQLGIRILTYGSIFFEDGKWWAKQNYYIALRCLRLLRLIGGKRAKVALKAIYKLPSYNQLVKEWVLACNELSSDEHLKWPFDENENIDLCSTLITDISLLRDLTRLRQLYFGGTRVFSLSPLSKLTSLQDLSLWGTPVNDLTPLSELTALQYLDISYTRVNNLNPLCGLANLKWLNCSLTTISDFTPISSLCNLEYLSLRSTLVDSVIPLEGLLALQQLDLQGTNVADLEPLLKLRELRSLNLYGTKIIEISVLSSFNSINGLILGGNLVNDLSPLAGLHSLETLQLYQINVTDLSPLIEIKSLKRLYIGETAILEKDLEDFKILRPDIHVYPLNRLVNWMGYI